MPEPTRVLLVDDDEDDYVLARDTLLNTAHDSVRLSWASSYEAGLKELGQHAYDACLVDYRLGIRNGAELIASARKRHPDIPFILITGVGDQQTDHEALLAGADDYIEKREALGPLLDRSIRYAIRHKATEQELAAALDQFRTLACNSQDYITRIDRNLCHVYMNPAMEAASGLANTECIGLPVHKLPANAVICDKWIRLLSTVLHTGKGVDQVLTCNDKVGGQLAVSWRITPESDQLGRISSILCSGRDITQERSAEEERRRLERELADARRFEALGRMAGGLAHNFNNLLTVINGYAAMIVEALPEDNPLQTDAQEILDAGTDGATIISRLLAFSQHAMTESTTIHPNQLISETVESISSSLPDHVRLNTELDATGPCVCMNRSVLREMLTGMITNSLEAIEARGAATGSIHIKSWLYTQDSLATDLSLAPGQYTAISIVDDGVGMDEEELSHLFEPFFTHKARTRGTGMTMAVAYGTIKQCQGDIVARSTPGQGTTITFYLPAIGEINEES